MLWYILGDDVFYCYYERVAERRMWFFFIRHFGAKEVALDLRKFFRNSYPLLRLDKSGWRQYLWAKEDWPGQQRKGQVISTKGLRHHTVLEGGKSTTRDSC